MGQTRPVGFDRLRPRGSALPHGAAGPGGSAPAAASRGRPGRSPATPASVADDEGRRLLFSSATPQRVPLGALAVECSRCRQTVTLSGLGALRAMVPSVHLPIPGRQHPSYLRCPACGRRSWVRLRLRV